MKHQSYPKYKNSGIDWLGEVPEHWTVKRLKFVIALNPSKSEVRKLDKNVDVQFLPMELVNTDGTYHLTETRKLYDVYDGFTYCKDGDVILAKITPCFENGKGALLSNLTNNIAFGSTEFHVLRPRLCQDKFIWYITKTHTFNVVGRTEMKGSVGQQRVPAEFIENFYIAEPSIEEQKKISFFLEKETTRIDALIIEKENFIGLLNEKRRSLISHVVTKGLDPHARMKNSGVDWLGEVPEHWNVCRIKYIGTAIMGLTYSPEDVVEYGTIVLRSTNLQYGKIDLTDTVHVDTKIPKKLFLKEGDILICSRNGSRHLIGKNALITKNEEGLTFGAFTTIVRSEYYRFVYYVLNSSLFDYQAGMFLTTTINQLTLGTLNNFEIPFPSKDEQDDIVDFLDLETAKIDALVKETQNSIDLLREHRIALINAAVTGKIDVRHLAKEAA